MSYRSVLTVTNLIFGIGGVYFALVAVMQEANVYTVFLSVLCFLSILFSLREGLYFSGPWRVASSVAVIVLLAGQEIVSFGSTSTFDILSVGTILLNGAFLVVFIGVLLSCAREITKQESSEEEEETEEPARVSR